ncbi:hypothetical protein Daus18300_011333 [Diaporthe australafricana]|uniref:Xylanolytic transcriptional activator regulatory domain-containing protein n=1 Tax=Diaporthe australafricana TaxID=127596 RepID=A0ABR3W717_9PEZI
MDQDGQTYVHGPSSMMHRGRSGKHSSKGAADTQSSQAATKARLISYAVVQRQSESYVYQTPPATMDLDGVDVELAKHLIDLHWNRQHFAYLLTYRPAVMESLATGGRWCNKLLLNAMYYTSSLYSDRKCLRTSPDDTQSAGDRFYKRFRVLLVDEIVKPSIPSAAALLLTGAALVSQDINIDIEREWRRRLYWGALVTDATQSLYLGRQMALRPTEGRVPQLFLDTYEELEVWSPYIDEKHPAPAHSVLQGFHPQPAYAVSTFSALIKLAQISARITQTFYNINCVKRSQENLEHIKTEIEGELVMWQSSLPPHLRYEPGVDAVPPPHQITPHTTYHSLNILLQRPFLDGGYLQDLVSRQERVLNEKKCVNSALAIRKLVGAYRDGLTLRRAPFLLSYSVYSAVVAILRRQSKDDPEPFKEAIGFFWKALCELQRGCNFGLRKPVSIIREMMSELGESIPQPLEHSERETTLSRMMDMYTFGNTVPSSTSMHSDFGSQQSGNMNFDQSTPGYLDFLDDQERTITDDTLYGLFAQESAFF